MESCVTFNDMFRCCYDSGRSVPGHDRLRPAGPDLPQPRGTERARPHRVRQLGLVQVHVAPNDGEDEPLQPILLGDHKDDLRRAGLRDVQE